MRFQKSHIALTDGESSEKFSVTRLALEETARMGRNAVKDDKQKERERFLRASHIPVAENDNFYGKSEMRE